MKLKDIKIGKRLVAGYAMFIVILLITCALCFKNMGNIDQRANEITSVNFEKVALTNSVLTNLQALLKETGKAVYTRSTSPLQVVAERRKAYLDALGKLEKIETDKESKEALDKLKSTIGEARESNLKLAQALQDHRFDEALSLYDQVVDPVLGKVIIIVEEMVKRNQKGVQEKYEQIISDNRQVKISLVVVMVISVILCVVVTSLITKSITIPIQKNIEVAKTLADGNLSVEIAVDRKDEFGDQLAAFKSMVEKWKTLIAEVTMSASNVASASHQLSASAGQLAKGAAAQVDKTAQVSTASEEMSQTSLDIARNANDISSSAKDMVSTAGDGSSIVNRSVSEVMEIAQTVSKSSELLKDLGEQSEQIGNIVLVINEIADQTNLLALNAAIEAARAGEHGRGFAVVADEVRKLAERTSQATGEIGTMIKGITSGVVRAVDSMSEASRKVATGVELSKEAGTALSGIVESSTNLQGMVQQIASAIEEMNATTDGIARDIEQVAAVTRDSSSAADQVTQAASGLSKLSVTLEKCVGEFKV